MPALQLPQVERIGVVQSRDSRVSTRSPGVRRLRGCVYGVVSIAQCWTASGRGCAERGKRTCVVPSVAICVVVGVSELAKVEVLCQVMWVVEYRRGPWHAKISEL